MGSCKRIMYYRLDVSLNMNIFSMLVPPYVQAPSVTCIPFTVMAGVSLLRMGDITDSYGQ